MSEKKWYVVYTKSRSEKKVAERLQKNGVESYCPTIKTVRVWSDRKRKVEVPMFTSYVFVKLFEKDRTEVLKDPAILNFIFWQGRPAIVKDREIAAIREIANNSEDVRVNELQLKKGQFLKIADGPFKGLDGEITDITNNIIIVYIEQLGFQIQFKYTKRFLK